MTDPSDAGDPTAWLNTDTVELTVKTLLSRFSRQFFTDTVELTVKTRLSELTTGKFNSPSVFRGRRMSKVDARGSKVDARGSKVDARGSKVDASPCRAPTAAHKRRVSRPNRMK
eukprot:608614-Prorocentrum_minimum.AAC.1